MKIKHSIHNIKYNAYFYKYIFLALPEGQIGSVAFVKSILSAKDKIVHIW